MVSKVIRSWPQGIYNFKPSISINMLNLMTGKELHNKPRGRNQRQASKTESNAYSSELKKKKKRIPSLFTKCGEKKLHACDPCKVYF